MPRLFGRLLIVLAALTLVATACGGGDSADLEAQTWTMTGIGGRVALPSAVSTLTFAADGSLNGNTGCNSFSTTYEVDGDRMTIDPQIAATLQACEPAVNDQEAAVFAALGDTTKYSIDGNDLRLLDDADTVLARYSADAG